MYTGSSRWKDFCAKKKDSEPPPESSFYKPFIQAANAILGAVPVGEKNRLEGKWLDRHNEAPQSSEDSAKARPDCSFVARPLFVEELGKEVCKLKEAVKLRDSTLNERKARLV